MSSRNWAAHVSLGDGVGGDEDAVGQGALAVVDVGDNAEVTISVRRTFASNTLLGTDNRLA
jgi:hypothetical protein